jgi:hypothetical protein
LTEGPHSARVGPARSDDDLSAAVPGQTLSQLLARILDQLSVSAWLPAGAFVFLLLCIGNLRAAHGDVDKAVHRIAQINIPALILLFGAAVVMTVLTQAFEFEAIRMLEGYWGAGRVGARASDLGCRLQTVRLKSLRRRQATLRERSWPQAFAAMHDAGIPPPVIGIVAADFRGESYDGCDADLDYAESIDFMDHAPAAARRRYFALVQAQRQYPPERRLLPTRLGNTLRAYESGLEIGDGVSLENYVRTVFDELPAALQIEHDQFRARLELYCSLFVVFLVSGALGLAALDHATRFTILGCSLALAWLSYRAGISSAREYGRVLQTIGVLTTRSDPARRGRGASDISC